jgi:lipoprotein-anchoring transpeptidase ErfK/SrfK
MRVILAAFAVFFGLMAAPGWAAAQQSVVVRRGDTLTAIALRYDTTVAAIMRANKIKTANSIYAGQRLMIPSGPGAAVSADSGSEIASVTAASGALPAGVPKKGKAIYVSVYQQRMYVYNNGKLAHKFVVSTGLPGRNTARGNFRVQSKYNEAWSEIWQLRMPYWMGIYNVGTYENGIHALPINTRGVKLWAGLLGKPASFGCVILGDKNAATLFKYAPVGTPVIIRN